MILLVLLDKINQYQFNHVSLYSPTDNSKFNRYNVCSKPERKEKCLT